MEDRLYIKLYQLRRRQAWVQAIQHALRAGLWGGWLSLLLVGVLGLLPLPPGAPLQGLWAWPAFTALGFLHGLLQPMSLRQVAHAADRSHHLQERLLTCLGQLEGQRRGSKLSQLLLQETLERVDRVDPRQTFPNRWLRPLLRWLVPASCVLLALLLAPLWVRRPADVSDPEVQAVRRRLSKISERLSRRPQRSESARRLERLLRQLPQQVPGQTARLLHKDLQRARQAGERQAALAGQTEAIRQSLGQPTRAGAAQAQTRLEDVSRKLDAAHPARSDLERARQALRQNRSEDARQALQQAQEQMEQASQDEQQLAQGLQQELQQLDPGQRLAQDSPGQGSVSPEEARPGSGQSRGKGQGQSRADFGRGSTDRQEGKSGPAQAKARSTRQAPRRSDKTGQYRQLYGVERHHLKTRRERVALQGGKGKLLLLPETQLGEARSGSPALRPEQRRYLEAKALAEQSVAEERVPGEHREAVRRYFDQIDPR